MKKILQALFPNLCVFCRNIIPISTAFCVRCSIILPWAKAGCQQCAHPLNSDANICGQCLKSPPYFQHTTALFNYQLPIIPIINQLKFGERLSHAKILGSLLADKIVATRSHDTWPELLIPVPLHRKRLWKRGYNQALEIAKPITKKLKIPLLRDYCIRKKNKPAQSTLKVKQRHSNIKNVFVVRKKLKATHVAIVDDVVTTGSTVNELSRVLQQAGVQTIEVWCCTRAISRLVM